MSPNADPFSFNIAGKIFLLGEYAVLAGGPTLVAAVGPRFQLSALPGGSSSKNFSAASPLGLLIGYAEQNHFPALSFTFQDPHEGSGGFGASTAQFALAYLAYAHAGATLDRKWESAWSLYRKLTQVGALPPSGADLISQWRGGVTLFDPETRMCMDTWPMMDWSGLLIFSAAHQSGRKIATHEHLTALAQAKFPVGNEELLNQLRKATDAGLNALHSGDLYQFGLALTQYGDALSRAGLEAPATGEDRRALKDLPDVWGCKGAGALQSDALLIQIKPRSSHREEIIAAAEKRGLRLISDGVPNQMGISGGIRLS